jgi:hypothetical protein
MHLANFNDMMEDLNECGASLTEVLLNQKTFMKEAVELVIGSNPFLSSQKYSLIVGVEYILSIVIKVAGLGAVASFATPMVPQSTKKL